MTSAVIFSFGLKIIKIISAVQCSIVFHQCWPLHVELIRGKGGWWYGSLILFVFKPIIISIVSSALIDVGIYVERHNGFVVGSNSIFNDCLPSPNLEWCTSIWINVKASGMRFVPCENSVSGENRLWSMDCRTKVGFMMDVVFQSDGSREDGKLVQLVNKHVHWLS